MATVDCGDGGGGGGNVVDMVFFVTIDDGIESFCIVGPDGECESLLYFDEKCDINGGNLPCSFALMLNFDANVSKMAEIFLIGSDVLRVNTVGGIRSVASIGFSMIQAFRVSLKILRMGGTLG